MLIYVVLMTTATFSLPSEVHCNHSLKFDTGVFANLVQVWGTRSGSKSCLSRDTERGSELERVTSHHRVEQSPVSRMRSMYLCCMLM